MQSTHRTHRLLRRSGAPLVGLALLVSVAEAGTGGRIQRAWAAGGSGTDRAYDVVARTDGSCIVVGEFWGTANFGATVLASEGESDAFVAAYDAKGTALWARRGGGLYSDRATQVRLVGTNIEVKGSAFGEVHFDSLTASFAYERTFTATYTAAGAITGSIGGANLEIFQLPPRRAEYDDSGAGVEVGEFTLALPLDSFGPTPAVLRSDGLKDAFVAEYGLGGTGAPELRWAISGGGPLNDWATAVDFVPDDNTIVVVGSYEGVADFKGTDDVVALLPTAQGSTDIFVLRVTLSDADNDGLSDLRERSLVPPTNAQLADSDGDGFSDSVEVTAGSSPTSASQKPTSLDVALVNAQFVPGADQLAFDFNGGSYQPNGIRDSDEFALLVAAISDDCSVMADAVRTAFAANLQRVHLDTDSAKAPMSAANSRKAIYAAYLTLGDSPSRLLAKAGLATNEGVTIVLANYSTAAVNYISVNGHADSDGVSNLAEYNAASGVRATYLVDALSPGCP